MPEDPSDGTTDETPKDDVVEYFGADGKDEGQEYHESGTVRPDLDDQTIAPPG